MRKFVALCFVLFMTCAAAKAPGEVDRLMPDARLSGEALYKKAIFKLYDAALWTSGPAFSWDEPFALTLKYRRGFSAERLADASIIEMARLTDQDEAMVEPIREALTACFTDVEEDDRITGFAQGPDTAVFFYNGKERCSLEWPGVRKSFFGIWLSSQSRAPDKAEILLGRAEG
jgi:hypothetical protein